MINQNEKVTLVHWDWTFEDAKQSMAHEVTTMVPLITNDNGEGNDNNDDHHDKDNHEDDFENRKVKL